MATANSAADQVRARLAAAGGALPWAEVMRLALYEPGVGYYRRGVRRIGRGGDFYTAVSVGPAFGELLAAWVVRVWRALGQPVDFGIIEQGAHDGTLAADILRALGSACPELAGLARYLMVEPDEEHRAAQRAALGEWASRLTHLDDPARGPLPAHAVFLANELLDAMPVHLLRLTPEGWRELHVRGASGGRLEFVPGPLSSPRLAAECPPDSAGLATGHVIEVGLAAVDWVREVAAAPFRGAVLILDYGVTGPETLEPERADGTLRRYRSHRSDDRVLEDLGECDLTSSVNFSRLAGEALSAGLSLLEFIEQGRFLTELFQERIAAGAAAPDARWVRQFQSLTHPGIMGRSFHALVLGKGLGGTPPAGPGGPGAARRRLGL